jgi:hypothetical protein
MLLSFAYLAFSAVPRLLVGGRSSEFAEDVELLVLPHQLVVLGRQQLRPSLRPADRAFFAALTRVLPQPRPGVIVTPTALLHLSQELERLKRAQPRRNPGRPPIESRLGELVLRFVRENPGWGYPVDRRRVAENRPACVAEHHQGHLLANRLGTAPSPTH